MIAVGAATRLARALGRLTGKAAIIPRIFGLRMGEEPCEYHESTLELNGDQEPA